MIRVAFALAALVASVLLLPLSCAPVYEFPPPTPFTGSQWLSPYTNGAQPWCRVNLHAHSHAWGGLTNGVLTRDQVNEVYAGNGTGAWAVSNYHWPQDDPPGGIRAYEHGYNLFKAHRLIVEPGSVDRFDAPLPTLNFKQYQVNRLTPTAQALIITHPWWVKGHGPRVLERLTGLFLLEVVSHYGRGDEGWDASLSAGRLVYGVGGDDTHNARDPKQTGVAWTQVHAPCDSGSAALVKALKAGDAYAVDARGGPAPVLRSMVVEGDTLVASIDGAVAKATCTGQGGAAREAQVEAADGATTVRCALGAQDPYVRMTVTGASGGVMLLNPVVRWDGKAVPRPQAQERFVATWVSRLAVWLAVGLLWWPVFRRRRRPPGR